MSVYASFIVTPSAGDVHGTEFNFLNTSTSDNLKQFVWDYGDGNIEYNTANPVHTYHYPGIYTVTLSAFDKSNNLSTTTNNISVDYVIRDYIAYTQYPDEFGTPGIIPEQPFKVYVQSAQIDQPLYVTLFAGNSPSTPYDYKTNTKWNFLIPNWYFTDKNKNIITQLLIDTVSCYNTSGKVIGVSGEGTFYYKDDISIGNPVENCPLVIIATLQTSGFHVPIETNTFKYPSYSNTTVTRATIAWQLYDYKPDYFKVTGNYIDTISPSKWVNTPIPVMITGHSDNAKRFCYSGVPTTSSGILFNFPTSNSIGLASELTLKIIDENGQEISSLTDNGNPLHFLKTDENGFGAGGYVFTTITPFATANNAQIVANTIPNENLDLPEWDFPYAGGYGPTPIAWISNPENKNIVKILSMPYPDNCETINMYKQAGTLIDTRIISTDTPYVDVPGNTFNYGMSGYSGIFSMSVFPGDQTMIAADAELDRLYKFSVTGKILSAVSLSGYTGFNPLTSGVTPAYTSIDRCGNIWVTLFNSASVLKLDHNFNLLNIAAPNGIDINTIFYGDDSHGDNFLKPAIVETDSNSNAWVTYTHPVCSLLVKYDQDGIPLSQTDLGNSSVTQALAVNKKNQLWVADSFNVTASGGQLRLFDTNANLLSSITGFSRPSYMCLDQHNNVWFTHGVRNIGYLDRATATLSSWYVDPRSPLTKASDAFLSFNETETLTFDESTQKYQYPELSPIFASRYDEELGGIAVDPYNRLWVIDSKTNNLFLLSATPNFASVKSRYFKIQPWTNIGFLNNVENTFTYSVTAESYKSAQATGDWTGNRWFQKYANFTDTIAGSSNTFNINDYNNNFEFRRMNESFNTAEYYKSLALPEILSQNTTLFDDILGAIVGTAAPSASEDMGQKVYERIANFTDNHSDVDTCNVKQLMSLAESMDVPVTNYSNIYPVKIQDVLDIASVPRAKLWGLNNLVPLSAETLQNSKYKPLDPATVMVSAGTKIFLQSIFDSKFRVTNVPYGPNGESVYPLYNFPKYGLIEPVTLNYSFYEYNPVYSKNLIESVIDWESEFTTINRSLSTADDLYKDGGIIETMFNYYLTKNLIHN